MEGRWGVSFPDPATEIILVRHAQTPCTLAGRFCGSHDPDLTTAGHRMAELLAAHPAVRGARAIVTSPAVRARATAEKLSDDEIRPDVDERLRELSYGDWEQLVPAEIADQQALQRWRREPSNYAPPGGEAAIAVQERALAAVADAAIRGGPMVVVTHKAPIRLLVAAWLGIPISRYRDLACIPVGSVTRVRLTGSRAVLELLGDVSHLPAAWRADPDRIGA